MSVNPTDSSKPAANPPKSTYNAPKLQEYGAVSNQTKGSGISSIYTDAGVGYQSE